MHVGWSALKIIENTVYVSGMIYTVSDIIVTLIAHPPAIEGEWSIEWYRTHPTV